MSDLIDRDALLKEIDKYRHGGNWKSQIFLHAVGSIRRIIENAPIVDAEPVQHASWILERDEMRRIYTTCDNCNTCVCFTNYRHGMKVDMRGANYCPNCGAKLDKTEDDAK